jgi:hypothetical protein
MIATFVNRIGSVMLADHTCPTSDIPFDSNGNVIAQFFSPAQRCFRGQANGIFVHKYGVRV